MKKLFFTLIFLFFVYFALQALFYFFGPGHNVTYNIGNYEIKEEYINKKKDENQAYNFIITDTSDTTNNKFYLQILKNFENKSKIIKEIKSYKDKNIHCIIPIFTDDQALTDFVCLKDDGIIYNYRYLKETIAHNDNAGNTNIEYVYDSLSKYLTKEDLGSQDVRNNIILYKNNMQPNYYFSLASYKGLIYANPTKKSLYAKDIYARDVYDNYLSSYVDKYFITVNYDEQYGYSKIYIYDITNGEKKELSLSKNIEKNSYIQGIYQESLYIFDRDNKIQYKIDTQEQTILEVGNTNIGVTIYKNGNPERVSAYECATKDIVFEEEQKVNGDYIIVAKTKGKDTGYTYYAKNVGEENQVYRVNNFNKNQLTYLFNTKYINKIIVINEYIYFLEDGYIKYYSDLTGIRTLAYNSELNFNQNIEYQIIYQK